MTEEKQHLDSLKDIRQMMQRSSRFISLSGLSGIAAGLCALAGTYFAFDWITEYYNNFNEQGYSDLAFQKLKLKLFILAFIVLTLSLLTAFYFTWRRAGRVHLPLWNMTTKNLILNMMIPFISGGLFITAMLQYDEWRFVVPASLIFYGLALVNGSKYTLSEVRYLGVSEIILGLVGTQFLGKGLYFWAMGFGLLHIVYGFVMWWKYERKPLTE